MRKVRWKAMSSVASGWTSGNENRRRSSFKSIMASTRLPVPVADLAHQAQDRAVGHVLELADQLGEQRRPLADDGLQVLGHLAGQGWQHGGVLGERFRQGPDGVPGRGGLLAPLDLAQV